MKSHVYILIILISFFSNPVKAQFDHSAFYSNPHLNIADSNRLSLSIYNTDFIKNNEYFSPIVSGYTLIGYLLQARLAYQVAPNVKIEAGIHLQKYSGLDKFTEVKPIFTVNYQPFSWANIIIGTLYGSANHRMIDPLFDIERYYKNNIEDGAQLLINHPRIHADLWLNWEQFIMKHSTFQEKIVAGFSAEIPLIDTSKRTILSIPVQCLLAHKGGQDLNLPDHVIETLLNADYGLHVGVRFRSKVLNQLVFKGYIVHYAICLR